MYNTFKYKGYTIKQYITGNWSLCKNGNFLGTFPTLEDAKNWADDCITLLGN